MTLLAFNDPWYDWAAVNVRLLWKHRYVHPLVRESIRAWCRYARQGPVLS